jgi:hypothetical protein
MRGVEHDELEAPSASRSAMKTRCEARAAHPEQDRRLEPVGRCMVGERHELADPLVHQVGDGEPAEAVGDLGRVVLPDRVVLAPDPLDDPVAIHLLETFGDH